VLQVRALPGAFLNTNDLRRKTGNRLIRGSAFIVQFRGFSV
jgi:hypothetical protein